MFIFSSDVLPKNSPDLDPVIHSLLALPITANVYANEHNDKFGNFIEGPCSSTPNTTEGSFFNDNSQTGGAYFINDLLSKKEITASSTRCFANDSSWAIEVLAPSTHTWWCWDSVGPRKNIGTAPAIFSPNKLCL